MSADKCTFRFSRLDLLRLFHPHFQKPEILQKHSPSLSNKIRFLHPQRTPKTNLAHKPPHPTANSTLTALSAPHLPFTLKLSHLPRESPTLHTTHRFNPVKTPHSGRNGETEPAVYDIVVDALADNQRFVVHIRCDWSWSGLFWQSQ